MIWREKRALLIALGVLLTLNTIFFFTYRVQYENRLRDLETRRDAIRAELEAARHARVAAEQQLTGYRKTENDVKQVYEAEWATQGERLAPFIAEVMKLANTSQLVPRSYSFSGAPTAKTPVAKKAGEGATVVGVAFSVEGTYEQVRRLINLLELSDQFIIIDQIGLTSSSGERLTMSIHLKTLFRDTAAAQRPPNQEL